jgi:hypothetical protein
MADSFVFSLAGCRVVLEIIVISIDYKVLFSSLEVNA